MKVWQLMDRMGETIGYFASLELAQECRQAIEIGNTNRPLTREISAVDVVDAPYRMLKWTASVLGISKTVVVVNNAVPTGIAYDMHVEMCKTGDDEVLVTFSASDRLAANSIADDCRHRWLTVGSKIPRGQWRKFSDSTVTEVIE